jgi:hypothetical protein
MRGKIMEINSRFVGTRFKPLETRITWRQTTNYAAAINDNNPYYLDDTRPEGIVAPPMFCVATTWPMREHMLQSLEACGFPMQSFSTLLHYTEHLQIHRLIRPDDQLTIYGHLAAILPHKSGSLVISRYDAYDQAEEIVFTEHGGALLQGIRCIDEGSGIEQLPIVPASVVHDSPLWETTIPIARTAPFIYDGCTNICYPIHTSVKTALLYGLPDVIYQGTATLAHGVREIVNRELDGAPDRIKCISCRFTGIVIPGSIIHVQLLGRASSNNQLYLHFTVSNADGKKAVRNGIVIISV